MISVVALLCVVSLSPADCTRDSAFDVITLPDAPNELACMMSAQQTLAALALRADATTRWIVRCSPKHGRNVAGVNGP